MSIYHSNTIPYELFPQLDTIQTSANGCNQHSILDFSPPACTQSSQPVYDPSSYYYYAAQGSSSSDATVVASSILDCEDVLFPSSYQQQHHINHSSINTTTSTSYQLMQSALSPCYTSNGESPLSIESDNFAQQQQQHNRHNRNHNQFEQLYVYGSTMELNVMTPPSKAYDMAVQPTFPPLPTSSSSTTTSTASTPLLVNGTRNKVGQHYHHHQRNLSSSSLSSFASSMSSPGSLFSSGSSFHDEHVHHTSMRSGSLFHCEYKGCTKTFTRTYNLKSHRRTHTDEKPFVCDMCPKAFARQHDRNRHAKLHLGLKPFPCTFCDKSFARQDALNRHLKRDKKRNAALITNPEDISILPPPCLLLKIKQKQKANLKKKKQLQ